MPKPGATTSLQAAQQLVRYSTVLYQRGWVANHDGNLSVRLGRGRLLITPTAMSKADITQADLVEVDERTGDKIAGRKRPFSELGLHLAVYSQRGDVAAVVHAHPPHATALGIMGQELALGVMPEPVVSLGSHVPLLGYGLPKSAGQLRAMEALALETNACLVARNGVFTWGPDLETAFLRMELVEHVAHITTLAARHGVPTMIPSDDLSAMVAAHHKAGLMAPRGYGHPEGADAPAIPRYLSRTDSSALVAKVTARIKQTFPAIDAATLEKLVGEELQRVL